MIGSAAQAQAPRAAFCKPLRISFFLARATIVAARTSAIKMLIPLPSRHWITVLSQAIHVAGEGVPNEVAIKPREYTAKTIVPLRFIAHQGAAISKASAPAFRCDVR